MSRFNGFFSKAARNRCLRNKAAALLPSLKRGVDNRDAVAKSLSAALKFLPIKNRKSEIANSRNVIRIHS